MIEKSGAIFSVRDSPLPRSCGPSEEQAREEVLPLALQAARVCCLPEFGFLSLDSMAGTSLFRYY